ncbi:hypothetical protein MUK42_10432 [Musa troglodytarum]|uniref:Uncharacterized protein n=1 Tax=Musa troglodytarum TaxID=320322 RepID=A0A9E7EUV8_9LILI|nr:hypothetical protein MUK42_10432 [Musa troglodytarum]
MTRNQDDIKHGAAQAMLSEDEMLRVGYKHGTPLGKRQDLRRRARRPLRRRPADLRGHQERTPRRRRSQLRRTKLSRKAPH